MAGNGHARRAGSPYLVRTLMLTGAEVDQRAETDIEAAQIFYHERTVLKQR